MVRPYTGYAIRKLEELRRKIHTSVVDTSRVTVDVDVLQCPHCGNVNLVIDYARGEVVCPKCGTVVVEHLVDVTHPEYRFAKADQCEHYQRVEIPEELGTAKPKLKNVSKRVTTIVHVGPTTEIRILKYAWSLLNRWKTLLNLDDITIRDAYRLFTVAYRKLRELDVKIHIRGLLCAAIYALRPDLTLNKIAQRTGTSRLHAHRMLQLALLYVPEFGERLKRRQVRDRVKLVKEYVLKAIHKLAVEVKVPELVNDEVRKTVAKLALQIVDFVAENCTVVMSGRLPQTVAAAITYIACKLTGVHINQETVAKTLGISEVAVRDAYKDILNKLTIVIEV